MQCQKEKSSHSGNLSDFVFLIMMEKHLKETDHILASTSPIHKRMFNNSF